MFSSCRGQLGSRFIQEKWRGSGFEWGECVFRMCRQEWQGLQEPYGEVICREEVVFKIHGVKGKLFRICREEFKEGEFHDLLGR